MLRRPRPRPRGLHSPRSAALHFVQQTRSAQRNIGKKKRPAENLPTLIKYFVIKTRIRT